MLHHTFIYQIVYTFISERTTICACTPLKSATASFSGRIIFSSSSSHKCLGGRGGEAVRKAGPRDGSGRIRVGRDTHAAGATGARSRCRRHASRRTPQQHIV